MAQVELINRSDIEMPQHNCEDENVDNVSSSCSNAPPKEEVEPIPKILKSYFTDLDGNVLDEITLIKEVFLVVETKEMSGEEVIINLPKNWGDFKLNGEKITEEKVLKLIISADVEKIKLEVVYDNSKKSRSSDKDFEKYEKVEDDPNFEVGGSESESENLPRELKRIVFKRKKIMWGEIIGISESTRNDPYGHWWVEIDDKESYGWWPTGQVNFWTTVAGVPGSLNRGEAIDPHHGDDGDSEFSPVLDASDTRTTDEVIECIRSFAKSYADTHPEWAYPATGKGEANCQSFQKEMIIHCKLTKKGTVVYKDNSGNETSRDEYKGEIEQEY